MYARSNCSVSPATAETAGSFKGIPVAFMGFSRARAKQLQPERFAPLGRARLAFELRATQQPDSRAQRSPRVRSWTASQPVVSRQLSENLLEQEKREPVEPALAG